MMKRLVQLCIFFLPLVGTAAFADSIEVNGQGSKFVINLNEGFDDPAHGADRQAVFVAAAQIWADVLVSPVDIEIDATFTDLACTSGSAVLGSAGPKTSFFYSEGAESFGLENNTFYPVALFNARTGADQYGLAEITASFNGDLDDNASCLNGVNWYYGLDHNPPGQDIDFFEVVLHELAHGLGVVSLVDSSGAEPAAPSAPSAPNGLDDAFSRWLKDKSTGELWSGMTDSERLHSMTDTGDLVWTGPQVTSLVSDLTSGVNGGEVQMYAPNPYEGGSSVSHFDTALTPNELMEPQHTGNASYRHTIALLQDIGWQIFNSTPVITGQQTLTMNEDGSLLLSPDDFVVTDSDHQGPVAYTLTVLSGNFYTVSGNRVIPDENFNGLLSVDVQISDGQNVSSVYTADITVNPVNDAPILSGNPAGSVTIPAVYVASSAATDVDDDPLTFGLISEHDWLSINQMGELSGTPSMADIGTADVIITVSDGSLQDSLTFPLTVQDAQSANLSVQLRLGRALLALNQNTTVVLTVTNEGPATSADGEVTVSLPAGMNMTGWESDCSALTARRLSCSVVGLGLNESVTYSLTVFSAQSVTGDIEVSVTGDKTDPSDTDNERRLTLIVSDAVINPTADIRIESDVDVLGAGSAPEMRADGQAMVNLATAGDHRQVRLDTDLKTASTEGTWNNSDVSFAALSSDLDRDGQRDLLFAQSDHVSIYRNGGESAQLLGGPDVQDVMVVDINLDTYPDILIAREGANDVYLNDQQGGFSLGQSLGESDSRAMAVIDADDDGWLDLLVANHGQADRLYRNLGQGSTGAVFDDGATTLGSESTDSLALAVGDFNGDGDRREVAVGRAGNAQNASVEWYDMVNGTPVSQQTAAAGDVVSLAAADRNGNGRDELLFVNRQGVVQLWHWQTSGMAASELYEQAGATAVLMVPLDGDDRADQLITARSDYASVVYLSPVAEPVEASDPPDASDKGTPGDGPARSSGAKSGTFGGFGLMLSGLLLGLFRRR